MPPPGTHDQPPDDAVMDLLVKQLVEGLSAAEQSALDALDSPATSGYRRDFERAASALSLAAAGPPLQPLPAQLKERLERSAQAFAAANPDAAVPPAVTSRAAQPARPVLVATQGAARPAPATVRPAGSATRGAIAGWLAAAACLVLALFGWLREPTVESVADTGPVTTQSLPPPTPTPPTPAAERAALLRQPGSLKVTLGATKDPAAAGLSGDVVWDPATQRGFIRFAGLAPNDPRVHQYQLWIFDAERDQRYPVDGGVFDIAANEAEVVIPIHAALAVLKPAAFAVTVEKPGGVVVSGREHVVALGTAG